MASRRKKEPKADLHITVNPLVVEYFEALRPIHGREYSEFCEEKLLALIAEVAPEKALEIELDIAEKHVLEIKQSISEVKLLRSLVYEKQKQLNDKTKQHEEKMSELANHREKMFQIHRRSLEYQHDNHLPHNWSKIQEDFEFKSKSEAENWIDNRMKMNA